MDYFASPVRSYKNLNFNAHLVGKIEQPLKIHTDFSIFIAKLFRIAK